MAKMIRCPNCGQKTSGDNCQWCNYPIVRRRPVILRLRKAQKARKAKEAEKQAKKEALIAARKKAKLEAEEARKAKEAEKQAKKEALIAARKKAKLEAQEAKTIQEAAEQARKYAEMIAREKAKVEAKKTTEEISFERYRKVIEPLLSLPIDREQIKQLEEYLKEIESICEELNADKIGTDEAIKRLRDISRRMS